MLEAYQPPQQMIMIVMNSKAVTHQECHPPWVHFFLESAKLVDAPANDFLPPSLLSGLVVKRCFFTKEASTDSTTGYFCILNLSLAFGLVLEPATEVADWDNPSEDCW